MGDSTPMALVLYDGLRLRSAELIEEHSELLRILIQHPFNNPMEQHLKRYMTKLSQLSTELQEVYTYYLSEYKKYDDNVKDKMREAFKPGTSEHNKRYGDKKAKYKSVNFKLERLAKRLLSEHFARESLSFAEGVRGILSEYIANKGNWGWRTDDKFLDSFMASDEGKVDIDKGYIKTTVNFDSEQYEWLKEYLERDERGIYMGVRFLLLNYVYVNDLARDWLGYSGR